MKRLLAALLCCVLLGTAAGAGAELRGYSKEEGYVYLTLGKYPRTAAFCPSCGGC